MSKRYGTDIFDLKERQKDVLMTRLIQRITYHKDTGEVKLPLNCQDPEDVLDYTTTNTMNCLVNKTISITSAL